MRTFLDTLEKTRAQTKRKNYEDRGKNTLNDGYTKAELEKVSKYFLTEKNSPTGSRDRLCFLLSHAMLCRSETTLGMQFADLFSILIENQGVSECVSLVATITFGKTNQHGKIEYGSSVRHRQVEVCSVGALAINLFSRFHFENEPFPDFTGRSSWYDTYVIKGENQFTPIEYSTQHKIYVETFKKVGIHTSKVTHANRKSALNMIAQENVPGDQQRMVGRWGTDRMVGCYVSSLPVEAMKCLAGFSGRNENYFLPRATVVPPMDLQVLVFPDIEFWQEKFKTRNGVQEDIAGPNFLLLLSQLRVVFLQVRSTYCSYSPFLIRLILIFVNFLYIGEKDSVVLKKEYPNYYLWNCSLFETGLYKGFEAQVLSVVEEEERAFNSNQLMQRAMPELVSTLEAGFSLMANSMQAVHSSHTSELQKLSKLWADFFALGSAHFNQGSLNSIPVVGTSPEVAPVVVDGEPENQPGAVPAYTLNREIMTVTDVWREFSNGLGGNPSVEHLEKEYGTAWRKDRKESRFFSRRNELYKAIKLKAEREKTSCEEAARRIEERRAHLGISLYKLMSVLKEDH